MYPWSDVTGRNTSDLLTSICIDWWLCFIDHGYRDIESIMWTHAREHSVGLTHLEALLRLLWFYMSSVGLKQWWCIILRPKISMISYMCNSTLEGCQTLLRNWLVIKTAFRYAMKHAEEYYWSDMRFTPPNIIGEKSLGPSMWSDNESAWLWY